MRIEILSVIMSMVKSLDVQWRFDSMPADIKQYVMEFGRMVFFSLPNLQFTRDSVRATPKTRRAEVI